MGCASRLCFDMALPSQHQTSHLYIIGLGTSNKYKPHFWWSQDRCFGPLPVRGTPKRTALVHRMAKGPKSQPKMRDALTSEYGPSNNTVRTSRSHSSSEHRSGLMCHGRNKAALAMLQAETGRSFFLSSFTPLP